MLQERLNASADYRRLFAEAFPDIALCNDLFVVDGSILTCAGATAALDIVMRTWGGSLLALTLPSVSLDMAFATSRLSVRMWMRLVHSTDRTAASAYPGVCGGKPPASA